MNYLHNWNYFKFYCPKSRRDSLAFANWPCAGSAAGVGAGRGAKRLTTTNNKEKGRNELIDICNSWRKFPGAFFSRPLPLLPFLSAAKLNKSSFAKQSATNKNTNCRMDANLLKRCKRKLCGTQILARRVKNTLYETQRRFSALFLLPSRFHPPAFRPERSLSSRLLLLLLLPPSPLSPSMNRMLRANIEFITFASS